MTGMGSKHGVSTEWFVPKPCRSRFTGLLIFVCVEEQFEYGISATNSSGETVYLTVYNCHGPAIGGNTRDPLSLAAADALAAHIRHAKAADYDYVGCWTDGFSIVNQGVRNGQPYYREEAMEPDAMMEMLAGTGEDGLLQSDLMKRFMALLDKGLYSVEEITGQGGE